MLIFYFNVYDSVGKAIFHNVLTLLLRITKSVYFSNGSDKLVENYFALGTIIHNLIMHLFPRWYIAQDTVSDCINNLKKYFYGKGPVYASVEYSRTLITLFKPSRQAATATLVRFG